MNQKILFLDIDGVLNSYDNSNAMGVLWHISDENKSRDKYGRLFDERCVRWLHYIVLETKCKIVITSSWRRSGLLAIQDMWRDRGLPGEVIDIISDYFREELYIYYQEEVTRGYLIEEWCQVNNPNVYCIVDDLDDILSFQNFVKTDSKIGLDRNTAYEIIKILNNK